MFSLVMTTFSKWRTAESQCQFVCRPNPPDIFFSFPSSSVTNPPDQCNTFEISKKRNSTVKPRTNIMFNALFFCVVAIVPNIAPAIFEASVGDIHSTCCTDQSITDAIRLPPPSLPFPLHAARLSYPETSFLCNVSLSTLKHTPGIRLTRVPTSSRSPRYCHDRRWRAKLPRPRQQQRIKRLCHRHYRPYRAFHKPKHRGFF